MLRPPSGPIAGTRRTANRRPFSFSGDGGRGRGETVAAAAASGGFGKTAGKANKADLSGGMAVPAPRQRKERAAAAQPADPKQQQQQEAASADGWAVAGKSSELFTLERPNRAVILPSGIKLCVYKFGNKVFASDLESTAYQFPLFDAKVFEDRGRMVAEVPFDGTQYDLTTGAVIKWCPREGGNLLRGVLGALKSNQPPIPLKVYPVKVAADGTVSVKLL